MTKKIVISLAILFVTIFLLTIALPATPAVAAEPSQDTDGCVECHAVAYAPWSQSKHGVGNVSCLVCHKLSEGTGVHPDIKYTVEGEDVTCMVCHTNVAGMDVAGQVQASKHGEVGLACITCHEPHSQGPVLASGSAIVCDNCHKNEMKAAEKSTHHAAGLNCINCHMGEERSHTLKVGGETCGSCHNDIHSANRILTSGIKIEAITTPMVNPSKTANPIEENEVEVANAGINLPSWILVVAGIIVGAITTWVLFGKEPGQPKRLG